jgi:hypothetical protein
VNYISYPATGAVTKVCYDLQLQQSLYDNGLSQPYSMTVMNLLLPSQLPNGGLRKGFLALVHPGSFGTGFRTQTSYKIRMNWWVSDSLTVQRAYLLDLNSAVSPPAGGTWAYPTQYFPNVRCSRDLVTDSFRTVTFDNNGMLLLENNAAESWLFFDMGPASSSQPVPTTTARFHYSACGDGISGFGEQCDDTSFCCTPETCMVSLPVPANCANSKKALLYLRSLGSLFDPVAPAPVGYNEYPNDPCRWTGMINCTSDGDITEMFVFDRPKHPLQYLTPYLFSFPLSTCSKITCRNKATVEDLDYPIAGTTESNFRNFMNLLDNKLRRLFVYHSRPQYTFFCFFFQTFPNVVSLECRTLNNCVRLLHTETPLVVGPNYFPALTHLFVVTSCYFYPSRAFCVLTFFSATCRTLRNNGLSFTSSWLTAFSLPSLTDLCVVHVTGFSRGLCSQLALFCLFVPLQGYFRQLYAWRAHSVDDKFECVRTWYTTVKLGFA